jgi:hypothetical protein
VISPPGRPKVRVLPALFSKKPDGEVFAWDGSVVVSSVVG